MKIKTAELKGAALDRAVARCEGWEENDHPKNLLKKINLRGVMQYEAPRKYSTSWNEGGPIIERYVIQVERGCDAYVAYTNKYWWAEEDGGTERRSETTTEGGDYLEAAMRCYVASKLGDEVEVPDELKDRP